MTQFDRHNYEAGVMGGIAWIRGLRVTVATVNGQIGAGHTIDEVLADCPYLEHEDILRAVRHAPWLADDREVLILA